MSFSLSISLCFTTLTCTLTNGLFSLAKEYLAHPTKFYLFTFSFSLNLSLSHTHTLTNTPTHSFLLSFSLSTLNHEICQIFPFAAGRRRHTCMTLLIQKTFCAMKIQFKFSSSAFLRWLVNAYRTSPNYLYTYFIPTYIKSISYFQCRYIMHWREQTSKWKYGKKIFYPSWVIYQAKR